MISAFVLAAGLAMPAMAQDKKAEKKAAIRAIKTLVDNDRVRVTESVFKPGEENLMEARAYRVTRVVKGSTTIERKHKNGKVEKIEWKEGSVHQSGPDFASSRNIGKGEVLIYTVTLKKEK